MKNNDTALGAENKTEEDFPADYDPPEPDLDDLDAAHNIEEARALAQERANELALLAPSLLLDAPPFDFGGRA